MALPRPPELDEAGIERVALGLLNCTLPAAEWTHAAHFAAALYLLRHRPDEASPKAMQLAISRYNLACGRPNTDSQGYHHTITVASLRAARAVLADSDDLPLAAVLRKLLASRFGRSDWLFAHWTSDALFTPDARRGWVEPDIRPLPF